MKLSKKGKGGKEPRTVSFEIMFWKRPNGIINLGTNDPEGTGFNVAVSDDPAKRNGHPTLYKKLDAILKMKGALDLSSK